jgi:hypothetical protein
MRDRLDDRFFHRKPGDPSSERACDKGLGPKSEHDAVTGRGLRRTGGVDHAVVIDGVRWRLVDGAKRCLVCPWLSGDDRSHLIVWKDRVNVKTAAEAEGFAP